MSSLRILLAGFGHVGQRFTEILSRQDAYPALQELDVTIIGITTGRHGALVDPEGLAPARILACHHTHQGFTHDCPGFRAIDTLRAVRELDFDVLVEVSPLSIAGKGEPAITHVREALGRGRHVVSANKGPVAWAYRELTTLAKERGVRFLHEATVMDGAPIFNLQRHSLRGNTILALEGILNSTTNVVLGEMEHGLDMQEAILRTQAMGIAEADPSADLDGWDAAVKLSALANALMDADLPPERIERQGIAHLTPGDLAVIRDRGRRLKLVCQAHRSGHVVHGSVKVCELPLEHPFARIEGADSTLRISTDLLGRLIVTEDGPDLSTTAYGVIADLLEIQG